MYDTYSTDISIGKNSAWMLHFHSHYDLPDDGSVSIETCLETYHTGWAESRYTVIIFFFFTGIVNDGRGLKYRTKKVDFEAVLEN
jgi:hypothetical protein